MTTQQVEPGAGPLVSAPALADPTPTLAIDAHHLMRRFGRPPATTTAVDDVCLQVAAGSWLAITGPSGCGKSTLLTLLGLLDRADAGRLTVAGTAVDGLSERRRTLLRRRSIGIVFQSYNLSDELSVLGNVALPLILAGRSRRDARHSAQAMLDSLGIGALAARRPTELSGGQQQRAAIGRALIARPALILADEPTGALDSRAAAEVVELFQTVHRAGQTIVMVTHDRDVAAAAERVVTMIDGRLVGDVAPAWAARKDTRAAASVSELVR